MNYSCEVVIDVPRARVVELFDDPDNLRHWQPELVRFEHLSGKRGQPGAKSKLLYRMGSGTHEMIETITSRNLPEEFSGAYEARGVANTVTNRFFESDGSTRWLIDTEFTFDGVMRVMAVVMSGSFEKQTMRFMHNFKVFAEAKQTGDSSGDD